jgi:REP element-mobilizing transposase RayT
MANTYTQLMYHVVFSTKNRLSAIQKDRREHLYRYIWGIHDQLKCHLYRIGGVEDHVHLLVSIHPTVSVSKFVETIKTGSTNWIRRESIFANWPGWQDGYGVFTHSLADKDRLIEYIKNQEEHHRTVSWLEEFQTLLEQAGVKYDPKFIE